MELNRISRLLYSVFVVLMVVCSVPLSAKGVSLHNLFAKDAFFIDTLSIEVSMDTTVTDSTKKGQKDALDAPVRYTANDSLVWSTRVCKDRLSHNSTCTVGTTKRVYHTAVDVHRDNIGF